MINREEFIMVLRAALKFAGGGAALDNILIHYLDTDRVRVISTDGHVMFVATFSTGNPVLEGTKFMLSVKASEQVCAALEDNGADDLILGHYGESVIVASGEVAESVACGPASEFVDYQKAMGASVSTGAAIVACDAVNSAVAMVCETLDSGLITIKTSGGSSPVVVSLFNAEGFSSIIAADVYIMPWLR